MIVRRPHNAGVEVRVPPFPPLFCYKSHRLGAMLAISAARSAARFYGAWFCCQIYAQSSRLATEPSRSAGKSWIAGQNESDRSAYRTCLPMRPSIQPLGDGGTERETGIGHRSIVGILVRIDTIEQTPCVLRFLRRHNIAQPSRASRGLLLRVRQSTRLSAAPFGSLDR